MVLFQKQPVTSRLASSLPPGTGYYQIMEPLMALHVPCSPCKRYLLFALLLLLVSPAVSETTAETLYVKPITEVTVRAGQGTEYRILAMIRDGSKVEVLEENEGWAKIKLTNGQEGWVLRRFLSDQPSLRDQLTHL